MKRLIKILACIIAVGMTGGCSKFVHAPVPSTNLIGSAVYSSNATAAGAVGGIYLTMEGNSAGGGTYGISALLGLSADEFSLYPGSTDPLLPQVYLNQQLSNNGTVAPEWVDLYNCIYQANSAISGILASAGVTSAMKDQLIGESEVIRAFCYFYLVNIYGRVPSVTLTNYAVNDVLARTAASAIFQLMVSDLLDAQARLGTEYLTPTGTTTNEPVRPNTEVASALLARVYLYEGKWDSAEIESSKVIGSGIYSLVGQLDSAFMASNTEAIWQLEVPNSGYDAPDGVFQMGVQYYGGPSSGAPFLLSDSLMASFEPGDFRRLYWVDSLQNGSIWYYFPNKYPLYYTGNPPVYFPTLFRLSEQYLIRAEARARKGGSELSGAVGDLNVVRQRAGLQPTSASTQDALVTAILKERRVELFTEYGHRWLDLIRSGTVNTVMSAASIIKGGAWTATDTLYPVPQSEIFADPNLVQNPGYN